MQSIIRKIGNYPGTSSSEPFHTEEEQLFAHKLDITENISLYLFCTKKA